MLQNYLNAMLLSITDEGDFKKLEKSAVEISKKLIRDKSKIVSYTLVAIDPDVSVENTIVEEVKSVLVKNWKTFANNAKDTPLTYIRAVVLDVLQRIGEDINHSLLIWFTSRNIVRFHKFNGIEKEIIFEFITKLGNDIYKNANKEWALSSDDILSKINIELKDVTRYSINEVTLKKYLQDASGPSNSDGEAHFDSPNPYTSNNSQWSNEFAPRAGKGIKNAIDPSLAIIASVVNENKKTIQNSLNKALEQVKKEISNRSKSLQLRSELLWWKEAGYSHSLDKSYCEIDEKILGIALAYDYSSFIPSVYPKSVDYFLKETYKGLNEDTEEELVLENFLKTFQGKSEELKPILPVPKEEMLTEKLTLLDFISGLVCNKYQLTQFQEIMGIPLNIELSSNELTTWLFHDFQLLKILNTK